MLSSLSVVVVRVGKSSDVENRIKIDPSITHRITGGQVSKAAIEALI
jgi:hypothetical protein